MGAPFQLLVALLCSPAQAGTVSIQSDAAVLVQFGETTIGRMTDAGQLDLNDLPAGPITLRLVRDGRIPFDAAIDVPEQGNAHIRLVGDTLTVQGQHQTLSPLANPIVILQPGEKQGFTMVIDQQDRRRFDAETMIEDLQPGTYEVEFRSADQLLVWARGTLRLSLGDTVALKIEEGRMVQAEGTADAWQPKKGL